MNKPSRDGCREKEGGRGYAGPFFQRKLPSPEQEPSFQGLMPPFGRIGTKPKHKSIIYVITTSSSIHHAVEGFQLSLLRAYWMVLVPINTYIGLGRYRTFPPLSLRINNIHLLSFPSLLESPDYFGGAEMADTSGRTEVERPGLEEFARCFSAGFK